jgi:amino acid adenylation domain-containing protein
MQGSAGFKISPQLERLWLAEPNGPQGRILAVVDVGDTEAHAVRAALEQVVERHEILRTTFARQAGMRVPLQVIHDELLPAWEASDGASLDARAGAALRHPFDLEHGPLVRGLSANGTLVLTLSSLVADESSVEVILHDLSVFLSRGEIADEPLQYADFSEWQHEQLAAADSRTDPAWAFWQRATEGPPQRIPFVRATPTGPADLAELPVEVDAVVAAALADASLRNGVQPQVLVQAAWHAFLSRATGQSVVVVETVGATPRHPDLEGAVGLIASPLPIRTEQASEAVTFAGLTQQLDRALAEAATYQNRPPAVGITAGGFVVRPAFSAGALRLRRVVDSGIRPPLALVFQPDGDRVRLALAHDRATIEPEHAAMVAAQLARLLAHAVADPGAKLAELQLLGDDDRTLLLESFNDTAVVFPETRAHELFETRASETPDAVAVTDGREQITYAALDARANQLARRLRDAGVGVSDVVALCTDRSVALAVGVLGILKAGGAYLPLNQEHPQPRLRHQLIETGAHVVVTQEALVGRLPELGLDVVCLDRDRAQLEALDPSAPGPSGSLDDRAYVIYTSGSTGTPKGVAVTHRNLSNYTQDMMRRLGADGEALVFGMVTAISTDLGNTAFFPALCSGGTLALIRPEVAADPAAFAARVADVPLDVLKITPSHLAALLRAKDGRVLPARWLVAGGERFAWDLADTIRELSRCRIMNHYGPTETTVGSAALALEDRPSAYASASVPIGRPISNTRCYVLDERGEPVPVGAPGRLFIGGAGVADGYVGRPELTAERFLVDPFAAGGRMYDSGDLVRRLPDGTLEFLGRRDEQVKIRGFRVEPTEVETVLRQHAGVAAAAVVAVGDGDDVRLVAYCVLRPATSQEELRRYLAEWLPDYMIPSAFVTVESLPLTDSGKVDRRALTTLETAGAAAGAYVAPRTAVEEVVAAIWADVLGLEQVSVEGDFFALGGHSLLATQVVAQVRTDFAIDLPLHSLFMYPTVAALSAEIVSLMSAADEDEAERLLAELEGVAEETG